MKKLFIKKPLFTKEELDRMFNSAMPNNTQPITASFDIKIDKIGLLS